MCGSRWAIPVPRWPPPAPANHATKRQRRHATRSHPHPSPSQTGSRAASSPPRAGRNYVRPDLIGLLSFRERCSAERSVNDMLEGGECTGVCSRAVRKGPNCSGHCERCVIVEYRNAHYLNCSHAIEATHMHQRIKISPAVIAVIVAVVGQAAILLNDFGPGKGSGSGNGMITAAAVSRAGAIEIPVGPGNHSGGNGMPTPAPVERAGAIEIPVAPGNHPHGGGMVTAAAVARAGAIEIPTGP